MKSGRRVVASLFMAAVLFLTGTKPVNGEVITLAIPVRSLSIVTFLLGVDQGFYQREGLELRPVVLKPDLAVRSVVAGEADFTSAFGSVVRGAIAGLPVQGLMMLNDEQPYFLLAAKGITSIGQLKGKVVGIAGIGGTLDSLTRAALRKGGLDPDKDVQLIDINTPAIGLNALQADVVEVSKAESFDQQAREAVEFIDRHRERLLRLKNSLGVQQMVLDCAVFWRNDLATHTDRLPLGLLKSCSDAEIEIQLSHYPVSE